MSRKCTDTFVFTPPTHEFGPEDSTRILITSWLRTEMRNQLGDYVEGLHLRKMGQEGGLQDVYIPNILMPCFTKIFVYPGALKGEVSIMFHNHTSNEMENPDYYNVGAFADWFAGYLMAQSITFNRQNH